VYRARDTRLKREVAIKVLPEMLAADPDRLARFQREAELLATLNHPNIAAVYGLEDSPSTGSAQAPSRAIVLELVDGETLADLIARGPVPLDDALRMARQIVDALEAAHDRGVVHRDLKPGNIKITPDGNVKVLDFGLAKMLESPAVASSLSMSPTLSVHATYAGVILGTAAYMSPEQARGKAVDRRTDVWAFGCVLFEMLTGKRVFDIWTADGQRVVFQSDREGDLGIFWQRADGVGGTERLTTADKDTEHIPESWSPKNDGFLFRTVKSGQNTLSTLSYFSLIEKARSFGGVQSVTPTNASFSPDGKWVVYETSALSGNSAQDNGPGRAVYVQPFPESGATYQVPIIEQGGYRNPRWSPDGKEIFYIIGGNVRLRVASVTTQPNLVFGNSVPLPKPGFWQDAAADRTREWDVTPDGQRFLVVVNAGQSGAPAKAGPKAPPY
jgi:serine/threonine protein kinase